ncbi:pentapeptide repeat-containing protein [Spiroplasma citri]|uniref:Pentapeptide repeat-containing protein n=1 Tax=Spiroplasma citri TaxID=2133 RepID=A0AAX3T021_SPICI|nr:pentapeptide repeat-containing protein [Spiroplasma citri]WFG96848.1 pentapeptide repeat-containing protein [Spiroplasma citri]
MKTLYEMIKDLTDITVEQDKISDYLENEALDLRGADLHWADLQGANLQGANLRWANLKGIEITKQQLDQLTVIEEEK